MTKKKKAAIAAGIVAAVLLLLAGAVYFIGHRYYAKTNYLTDEEAARQIEEQKAEQEAAKKEETVQEEEEEEIDPELLEAQKKMEQYASTEPITTDGNVYNVMLVGLDTTKEGWVGNSDSMILLSINYRLHKISMISMMRDLRANIPGVGYRKLNAAYPNGGGPLLTATIEENFKIDVDRYVAVDFGQMIDIIDAVGPIELTFTEKEAENANKSIKQQCRILKKKSKKYLIPGEGTYECSGMQAVAYARIRKVGNSDYQRTERQREVLMKMLENVKKMSLEELDILAARLLPMLTHNIPESEFWGLLAKAPTLLTYNITQDRIPYDGMFYSYNGNLIPDSESTVRKLKETIYGADVLDEEGNVVTPEPTQTPEVSTTPIDTQEGGTEEVPLIEPTAEKKAAVIADNKPDSLPKAWREWKKYETLLLNPYRERNVVLRVPQASLEEQQKKIFEYK
ncbi:MAG: LCP family protein [Clostridiales bacterium]|nr:LCP family protein [Clostridiales bacterium]